MGNSTRNTFPSLADSSSFEWYAHARLMGVLSTDEDGVLLFDGQTFSELLGDRFGNCRVMIDIVTVGEDGCPHQGQDHV